MKTLVIANSNNGTWLAEHLGCTLLNGGKSGDGLVTNIDQLSDVWDRIYHLDPSSDKHTAMVYGSSALGLKMTMNPEYADTVLQGGGLVKDDGSPGIQCGLMRWWEDGKWVGSSVLVVEQVGLMNRDLGPALPEAQGVTLIKVPTYSPLVTAVMPLLEPLLTDYNGPVCIGLSVTMERAAYTFVKLGFQDGWVETLLEIQRGPLHLQPFDITDNVAVGIHVSVPPYPYDIMSSPTCIEEVEDGALKHMAKRNVYIENKQYMMEGSGFYATAWGKGSEQEARMRIYRSLRGIKIKGMQYRTDISTTFPTVFEQLTPFLQT